MTYQGTVKNGVVIFESVAPPDGTHVRVEPVGPLAAHSQPASGTIWDKMRTFVGRADELPADAARNHDHYLYGKPKR